MEDEGKDSGVGLSILGGWSKASFDREDLAISILAESILLLSFAKGIFSTFKNFQ